MIKKIKENILFKNILVLINIVFYSIISILVNSYCFNNDWILKTLFILNTSLMLVHIIKLAYKNDKKILSPMLNIILLINSVLSIVSIDTWFIIILMFIIDLIYLLLNIEFRSINKNKLILFNIVLFIVSLLASYNFSNDYIRYSLLVFYSLIFIIFIIKNRYKIVLKPFILLNILILFISFINCTSNLNYTIGVLYILLNFILMVVLIFIFNEFKLKLLASICLISFLSLYTINYVSRDNLITNMKLSSNDDLISTYNELIKDGNDYSMKKDYEYVHIVEKIDCNDWKNTLYTIADTGLYYDIAICSTKFDEKKSYINAINSFVHPFNMLDDDEDFIGKRKFDSEAVNDLTSYVDSIYDKLHNENLSAEEIIKKFHNELISTKLLGEEHKATSIFNQTKTYDSEFTAVIMKLFLDKLGIENKIVYGLDENNVWNIVKINDEYLHLDVYYDNKLSKDDVISYKYFLTDDSSINYLDSKNEEFDNSYHRYNKNTYKEFIY